MGMVVLVDGVMEVELGCQQPSCEQVCTSVYICQHPIQDSSYISADSRVSVRSLKSGIVL